MSNPKKDLAQTRTKDRPRAAKTSSAALYDLTALTTLATIVPTLALRTFGYHGPSLQTLLHYLLAYPSDL